MIIDENNVAYKDIFVRARDTDMFYNATIPFYFSAIQEMGGEHAAEMGIAIDDLIRDRNWTWVITRTHVVFHSFVSWRDTLHLESWPENPFQLHFPRVVRGYKGEEPVFDAMTLWAVLDLAKKRPVRPKELMGSIMIPQDEKHFVNPDIGKVRPYESTERIRTLPVYKPSPVFYDLDYNRHVNNTVYLDWIMAAMDEEVMKEYLPSSVDVQWKKQTFSHDRVYVETALASEGPSTLSFAHRIMKEEEGEDSVVFEASSEWRKKDQ